VGVAWAVCVLFAGWAAIFGWCTEFVAIMASIYIGFKANFFGSIIGAVWGFIDGAIGGGLIAVVYNAVIKTK
jgi:hypothetical protein